ncbi:MAG: Gfo/Idh/MocA family oxidoreductase [Actinomycetia bacterium]|nr:Gfo/Idh/MocA family oxidoreductase [Actinomycetes bacterium]
MTQIRAAVIGAGNMGRHHVRILDRFDDVDLVGVVDPGIDPAASSLPIEAARHFASIDDLPRIDFAVIATPTQMHTELACALAQRGAHLLVEKPLAESPEDARRIVDAAEKAGVILAVGHVERFNPAVRMLAAMASDPRLVQFERLSPFTPRIRDSVVFDLMVHDLDLACWICGGTPVCVQASGAKVFSDSVDVAAAVLEFENGRIASLETSRATQDKVRRIAITEPERYLVADSIRQDLSMRRQTTVEFEKTEPPIYRQASVVEIPYVDRSGEPLAAELRDVIDAIRASGTPMVTGRDGLRAVELAFAVEAAIGKSSAAQ